MQALRKLVENTKKLTEGKVFILTFSDPTLKKLVISLNHDQLRASQLSDDSLIPFIYSNRSIDEFGKSAGRWTLHDTGELYDSFKVVGVTQEAIIEFGDLEKEDRDFEDLFNGNVLGLNSESKAILMKKAIPKMVNILRAEMLKGI